jgi:hypothetical protein
MRRTSLARTRRRTRILALGASACAAIAALSGCMLSGQSRMAQGYSYKSGKPAYDAFFNDVHQQQLDATSWSDDRKGTRKALAASLELAPETPDVTVVQSVHESASKVAKQPGTLRLVEEDGASPHVLAASGTGDASSLFHAIEDAARQELERAKRLRAVEPKLDALSKQEADLETHVKADFSGYGGGKEVEVEQELTATKDVVAKLKARAETEARASEDFVADLGRALETASEERRAEVHKNRPPRKRDDASPSVAAKRTAADQPPSALPPKPAPPPPPTPKPADTGEVFTP